MQLATTAQAVQQAVLQAARHRRSRLFDMVPPRHTGPPAFYVVHAWTGCFVNMVRQLSARLCHEWRCVSAGAGGDGADGDDAPSDEQLEARIFVWLDIVALNQFPCNAVKTPGAPPGICILNEQEMVRACPGGGVVVIDKELNALTRTWCLYEMQLLVALPEDMQVEDLVRFEAHVHALDITRTSTGRPDDRGRLLTEIKGSAGVTPMQRLLSDALVMAVRADLRWRRGPAGIWMYCALLAHGGEFARLQAILHKVLPSDDAYVVHHAAAADGAPVAMTAESLTDHLRHLIALLQRDGLGALATHFQDCLDRIAKGQILKPGAPLPASKLHGDWAGASDHVAWKLYNHCYAAAAGELYQALMTNSDALDMHPSLLPNPSRVRWRAQPEELFACLRTLVEQFVALIRRQGRRRQHADHYAKFAADLRTPSIVAMLTARMRVADAKAKGRPKDDFDKFTVVRTMVRLKYGEEAPLNHALISEVERSLGSWMAADHRPSAGHTVSGALNSLAGDYLQGARMYTAHTNAPAAHMFGREAPGGRGGASAYDEPNESVLMTLGSEAIEWLHATRASAAQPGGDNGGGGGGDDGGGDGQAGAQRSPKSSPTSSTSPVAGRGAAVARAATTGAHSLGARAATPGALLPGAGGAAVRGHVAPSPRVTSFVVPSFGGTLAMRGGVAQGRAQGHGEGRDESEGGGSAGGSARGSASGQGGVGAAGGSNAFDKVAGAMQRSAAVAAAAAAARHASAEAAAELRGAVAAAAGSRDGGYPRRSSIDMLALRLGAEIGGVGASCGDGGLSRGSSVQSRRGSVDVGGAGASTGAGFGDGGLSRGASVQSRRGSVDMIATGAGAGAADGGLAGWASVQSKRGGVDSVSSLSMLGSVSKGVSIDFFTPRGSNSGVARPRRASVVSATGGGAAAGPGVGLMQRSNSLTVNTDGQLVFPEVVSPVHLGGEAAIAAQQAQQQAGSGRRGSLAGPLPSIVTSPDGVAHAGCLGAAAALSAAMIPGGSRRGSLDERRLPSRLSQHDSIAARRQHHMG
ncbi:hypothetical protein FOA52_014181 [Chlamydomonas sp. UWO 241]|nr:hypothetical protein FOA52_014181 [Chlamydomonas sp. UWO 241]